MGKLREHPIVEKLEVWGSLMDLTHQFQVCPGFYQGLGSAPRKG